MTETELLEGFEAMSLRPGAFHHEEHVRLARMTLGWLLLITGVAMLALPGPGWITIAAALAILSKDFLWAERTLARIAHRIPKGEDGEIHTGVIVFSGLMLVLALAGSGWWYLLR